MGQKEGATVVLEDHGAEAVPCGMDPGARGEQRLPTGGQLGSGGSEKLGDIVPDVTTWAPSRGAF